MSDDQKKPASAVTPPHGAPSDWQAKIAKARAAREQGRVARANKPASFRLAVGHHR